MANITRMMPARAKHQKRDQTGHLHQDQLNLRHPHGKPLPLGAREAREVMEVTEVEALKPMFRMEVNQEDGRQHQAGQVESKEGRLVGMVASAESKAVWNSKAVDMVAVQRDASSGS